MEIPSPAPALAGSQSPGLGQQQTPPRDRRLPGHINTDTHVHTYVRTQMSRGIHNTDSYSDTYIHRKIISIIITNIYCTILSTNINFPNLHNTRFWYYPQFTHEETDVQGGEVNLHKVSSINSLSEAPGAVLRDLCALFHFTTAVTVCRSYSHYADKENYG